MPCLLAKVSSSRYPKVNAMLVLAQMLSQDLLNASLQIPFSVPPYMSLLARAVATLEGIALSGNPDYQMVAEVHPPLQHAICTPTPEHAAQSAAPQISCS